MMHTTAQGSNHTSVLALLFQMVERIHSMTSRKRLEGFIRGNIVRGRVQTHIWKSLAS